MILRLSPHQGRDLHEPSSYLLDEAVPKPVGSTHRMVIRDPVPELLFGDRQRFQPTVARLPFKLTCRVATLTWSPDELDWQATRYTVHVNGPWCVAFEFRDGDAHVIDFEQYH